MKTNRFIYFASACETMLLILLVGLTLAACSSSWNQRWCWFGGCREDIVPTLPPPLPPRAIAVMNMTVTYCGFQPNQDTAEALILATPARSEESIASAICAATKPRWLMNRGFLLPEVEGVPIRGRFVR